MAVYGRVRRRSVRPLTARARPPASHLDQLEQNRLRLPQRFSRIPHERVADGYRRRADRQGVLSDQGEHCLSRQIGDHVSRR